MKFITLAITLVLSLLVQSSIHARQNCEDNCTGCSRVVEPVPDCIRNPRDLCGKTVLVVGGSRGNGRAIAEAFCQAGCNVIATSRFPENYPQLTNPKICCIPLDIRSEECVQAFFDTVFGKVGQPPINKLDILVNNAAIFFDGFIYATSTQNIIDSMQVNFFGHHRVTQRALKHMQDPNLTPSPRIITLVSESAVRPSEGFAAYGIAKTALLYWNNIFQIELDFLNAQNAWPNKPYFTSLEPTVVNTTGNLEFYAATGYDSAAGPVYSQPFVDATTTFVWKSARGLNDLGMSSARVGEAAVKIAQLQIPAPRYILPSPKNGVKFAIGGTNKCRSMQCEYQDFYTDPQQRTIDEQVAWLLKPTICVKNKPRPVPLSPDFPAMIPNVLPITTDCTTCVSTTECNPTTQNCCNSCSR